MAGTVPRATTTEGTDMAVINGVEFAGVTDEMAAKGRAIVAEKTVDQLKMMANASFTKLQSNPTNGPCRVAIEAVKEELARRGIAYEPVAAMDVRYTIPTYGAAAKSRIVGNR
jgi:hypothetical protein